MRIIGHIDMDAFFAAIEERDNPRFRGVPLVVGADPQGGRGRGVVATANYKAREYGIRSALPISTAWKYSEEARRKGLPPAVFVGGSFSKYSQVSKSVMKILRQHVPVIEEASVDEAYLDLSFASSYKKAEGVCKKIKKAIKEKEQLTASIGIGPNKLVAKIASDRQKPDGLTVVTEASAEAFLEPLSMRVIPGLGPKTEAEFQKLGFATVKDLKSLSLAELTDMMGKWGGSLYRKLRAQDDAPVQEEWEAKSVGEQETFEEDTLDPNFLQPRLKELADGVHRNFLQDGFKSFRTITLTVRFADFSTKTRSSTFKAPEHRREVLEFESLRLFLPFLDARENPRHKAIRLIGVRVEKLA